MLPKKGASDTSLTIAELKLAISERDEKIHILTQLLEDRMKYICFLQDMLRNLSPKNPKTDPYNRKD